MMSTMNNSNSYYHFASKRPAEDLILGDQYKLPGNVAKFLTNFQLEGIRFLFKHFKNNQSCILNDESGLGKTVTVCAFLETVLPNDGSRKCLIIVRNDERTKNWMFHLDALTKLQSKIAFNDKDVGKESVYITKWDCLQKSASLLNCNFDCIIVDNRGELISNKICSGYLLRNYENKVSLIVSSSDVAVDLKQFHTMLRLCGRLDKEHYDLKVFEDKFSLPMLQNFTGDVNLLESYFIRRERIINFCRDFRIRRYRHQFETELPLVKPETYSKTLTAWKYNPLISISSSSSSSVKILTSSSEKEAEQLLRSFFDPKEEHDLNVEISKITSVAEENRSTHTVTVEGEHMSPLLFESDSEDTKLSPPKQFEKEYIIPIVKEVTTKSNNVIKKVQPKKNKLEDVSEGRILRNTHESGKKIQETKGSIKKEQLVAARKSRSLLKNDNTFPPRNLRSDHATRSKSKKNKYLIVDIKDDDMKKSKKKLRKNKKTATEAVAAAAAATTTAATKRTAKIIKTEQKQKDKDKKENSQVKQSQEKIDIKNTRNINKCTKEYKKLEVAEENLKRKETSLRPKTEKINYTDATVNTKKKPSSKFSPNCNTSSNKKRKILETIEIDSEELQNSGEVHCFSPHEQLIVLSSSTDESLNNDNRRKKPETNNFLSNSPDIFSSVDESDIICSQKNRLSEELKTLNSIAKGSLFRNKTTSCLDLLEKEFHQKDKKRSTYRSETEEIYEISTSETFRNYFRVNPNNNAEVTPTKNRSIKYQKNKITKYLVGSEILNSSDETVQSPIKMMEFQKMNGPDHGLQRTPTTRITQRATTITKKSPKITRSRSNMTPNSLTKWLIKANPANDASVATATAAGRPKSTKRRRLDLLYDE